MSNHDFSDRLLSAEQTTPAFRGKYDREIRKMLEKTLTPTQRFAFGFSTVLSIGMAVFFTWAAIIGTGLPPVFRAMFGLGVLVTLAWTIIGGKIVLSGKMHLKTHPNALTGMMWGFVLTVQIVILMWGGQHPESVKSVYMAIYGLTFLLMAALFMLNNRIEQSELNTKQKLLGIELRLAEIAESLPKKAE